VTTPCEVVRARDYRLVGTRIHDLSSRGMLLETDMPILTGESLVVTFAGPPGAWDRGWYTCDATVTRVVHGRRRGDVRRAVGVAFETLDPCAELWLCEHLRASPLSRSGPGDAPSPARR
jgi:hypothetical protein